MRRCSSKESRRDPSPATMWRAAQVRGSRIESEVESDLSPQSERGGSISSVKRAPSARECLVVS